MPTSLNLTFKAAPLPYGWTGTPQQFLTALIERMSAEQPNSISFFQSGSTVPSSNQGPFLKDDMTWYVWDNFTGQYVPELLDEKSLRYTASATAPDHALYTFWIKLDSLGKATAIMYYNIATGAWRDVYQDKFDAYDASILALQQRYAAAARTTASQTVLVDGSPQKISFPSAFINSDSVYDETTSKYVVKKDGIYSVTANLQVQGGTATSAGMALFTYIGKNGSTSYLGAPSSGVAIATPPGDRWYPKVNGLVEAVVGDELEVYLMGDDGVLTGNVEVSNSQFFVNLVQ